MKHAGERRYGRTPWIVLGLALAALLFALLAWPRGDAGGGGGPLNAIAAAASKTKEETGGRVIFHALAHSSSDDEPLVMVGHAVFNAEGRSRMQMRVPRPPEGDPFAVEAVMDGTFMYMRSSRFGELPDGAKWMGLDLSLGEMESQSPASFDAKSQLGFLESAGGDVQKLGQEDVRGVPTRHYGATISVADRAATLREKGADDLADAIEDKGSAEQVEAWIDGKGLVRRMRLVTSQPSEDGDSPMTMDMRMDFFDFGIDPQIDLPDSDEVFDATDQARENLGLSDG